MVGKSNFQKFIKVHCQKCKLAGKLVSFVIGWGRTTFGVKEKEIRKGLINVLEGIARYGITLPQIVNAPFLVVWDFTHLCNLGCKHCYLDAQKLIDELAKVGVVTLLFWWRTPDEKRFF